MLSSSKIHRSLRSARLPLLGFLTCVLATAGCVATVRPPVMVVESEEVVVVDTVPVNVEQYPDQYPQESYGGRTVIYIGGRWHYRAGPRWMAYRHEPVELGRRRVIKRPPDHRPQQERHDERRDRR